MEEEISLVIKKSGFKKATSDDRIDSVFAKLEGTHDAVFVFEKKKLAGIINLYHATADKKVSPREKVKTCLYHPPILNQKTSLMETARLMVESRVYRLPVIEKDRFLGVVFAEDILKKLSLEPIARKSVDQMISIQPPVTIDLDSPIDKTLTLMIKRGTTRILVVDKNGSLLGIVTLFDLRKTIVEPKNRLPFLTRSPVKKDFSSQKVKKFYHRSVVSIREDDSLKQAVNVLVSNKVSSIVVFPRDSSLKPAGMVTVRDILKFVSRLNQKTKKVSLGQKFDRQDLSLVKKRVLKKVKKILMSNQLLSHAVESIRFDLKEIAKSNSSVRLPLLQMNAAVRLSRGGQIVRAKVKGRIVSLMVDQLISTLKRLIRKQKQKSN